jgi:hypothetical protein
MTMKKDVDQILGAMPAALSNHIKGLMEANKFNTDEEHRRKFLDSWLQKKALFDKIIEHNGLSLTEKIPQSFTRGFFLLTYSGSLLTVTPADPDGRRDIVYESIGTRSDTVLTREFSKVPIRLPVKIHSQMFTDSQEIPQTSAILSIAVEPTPAPEEGAPNLRVIGQRISRSLILVNQALFSKHSREGDLESRDDLFEKWIILQWFRIGGWEEAVFLTRAKILFLELFSRSFNTLKDIGYKDEDALDTIFLSLVNSDFPEFVDRYKWLESEKQEQDIGLMKALETIPGLDDYKMFLETFLMGFQS